MYIFYSIWLYLYIIQTALYGVAHIQTNYMYITASSFATDLFPLWHEVVQVQQINEPFGPAVYVYVIM